MADRRFLFLFMSRNAAFVVYAMFAMLKHRSFQSSFFIHCPAERWGASNSNVYLFVSSRTLVSISLIFHELFWYFGAWAQRQKSDFTIKVHETNLPASSRTKFLDTEVQNISGYVHEKTNNEYLSTDLQQCVPKIFNHHEFTLAEDRACPCDLLQRRWSALVPTRSRFARP